MLCNSDEEGLECGQKLVHISQQSEDFSSLILLALSYTWEWHVEIWSTEFSSNQIRNILVVSMNAFIPLIKLWLSLRQFSRNLVFIENFLYETLLDFTTARPTEG